MKEYVSREWLENKLRHYMSKSRGAEHYAYNVIKEDLDFAPDTEVIELKYGHWVPLGQRTYGGGRNYTHYCSECGRHGHGDNKFCPDCGAKMINKI